MKIKLHLLPEKPSKSCEVVVFVKGNYTGKIILVSNVGYSAKLDSFNAYDHMTAEDISNEYNDSVVAWAYMDEVNKEVKKCLTTA